MRELMFGDMAGLASKYKDKLVSPTEVIQYTLSRIETLNPLMNAYITIMAEEAMEQAQQLEDEIQRGEIRGPLHGVPIAVKDIVQTKGVRTTAGSKVLADWIPNENATIINKLKAEGAIILGKANLHEFAMGATTENPQFGNARNPWHLGKIAGGSSGGSAVAVAAGMGFGAVGSDTAGSIRLPSALCGIVGLKPTYGLVSRHGVVPFSWSLDHLGPMTRTVKDAAVLLKAMAGFDPKDQSSVHYDLGDYTLPSDNYLKGKRFGICKEYFFDDLHPEISDIVYESIRQLEALGAEMVEIEIPGMAAAQQASRWIAQAEGNSFHQPVFAKKPELYSEDIRYRLNFGRSVSAEQYLSAQKTRKLFVEQVLKQMDGIDALVSPMNHNPPFDIGSVTPEQAINNMFNLAKAPIGNFLGFPAVTLPIGLMSAHLPVGLQLIGKPFADYELLRIAQCLENEKLWLDRLVTNKAYEHGSL